MSAKQKYKELVALLEKVGVLQLDDEWAKQVQEMIKSHKNRKVCDSDRVIRDLANDITDGCLS